MLLKNQGAAVKDMRVRTVVVAFILLVLFGSTNVGSCRSVSANVAVHDVTLDEVGFSTHVAIQGQNVTYTGELLVSDNETFAIQDSEFYLKIGKITVRDSSTLIIRNSQFTAISRFDHFLKTIVLEDQSKLIVENATLIAGYSCHIDVQNDAVLNVSRSTLQKKRWEVTSYDEAEMHVDNSTITSGDIWLDSWIGTFGTSSLTVENSDVDYMGIWRNSTVSIKNSVVGLVRAGGMTDVHITDSEIRTIEAWDAPTITVEGSTVTWQAQFFEGSSSKFIDSSVAWVDAHGNATVELIDSHARNIDTDDNATVLLGWHLPLFGLVTTPYTWVPTIQIIAVVALTATIITVSVFVLRNRARRAQREPEHEADE